MKLKFITSLLMSLFLSIFMTCWVTWINLGWSSNFVNQWLNAFIFAWPAAAIIVFIIGAPVQNLSKRLAR